MSDAAGTSQGPITERTQREELQQEWIAAAADYSRRASEALVKAADVLANEFPGLHPDGELAGAWAALGQGWATLSCAEAARTSLRRPAQPGRRT